MTEKKKATPKVMEFISPTQSQGNVSASFWRNLIINNGYYDGEFKAFMVTIKRGT